MRCARQSPRTVHSKSRRGFRRTARRRRSRSRGASGTRRRGCGRVGHRWPGRSLGPASWGAADLDALVLARCSACGVMVGCGWRTRSLCARRWRRSDGGPHLGRCGRSRCAARRWRRGGGGLAPPLGRRRRDITTHRPQRRGAHGAGCARGLTAARLGSARHARARRAPDVSERIVIVVEEGNGVDATLPALTTRSWRPARLHGRRRAARATRIRRPADDHPTPRRGMKGEGAADGGGNGA